MKKGKNNKCETRCLGCMTQPRHLFIESIYDENERDERADGAMKKEYRFENNEKIVPFPNLSAKLVEKGMNALQNKRYREALTCFDQLLALEPDHPQANLGKTISFVQLGELEKAVHACERMLKEDIADDYDVLQIYISALIQLEDYDKVVRMLDPIIQEETLPSHLAESFDQLLRFSRNMSEREESSDRSHITDEQRQNLIEELESGKPEKQWRAIQQLSKYLNDDVFEAFKRFLRDERKDPFFKSIILHLLKEQQFEKTVQIHKFSCQISVNPAKLQDVFQETFSQNVLTWLSRTIENENPTLYHLGSNIWRHYLFAIFPLKPIPQEESVWAAAVHSVSAHFQGIFVDLESLSQMYGADHAQIESASNKIVEVETLVSKGFDWNV